MFTRLLLLCLGLVLPSLGARLPYIIGGTTVYDATKWPHMCSLRRSGSHICGASIISSTWLVTAASCLSSTSDMSVKCGSVNRFSDGVTRDVKQAIPHEDYGTGSGTFPNNIGVIRVDALTFSSTIKAINMATSDQSGNGDCYITGWGYTTIGYRDLPEYLQEANINVYTQSECKAIIGSSLNDGHVCAGDTKDGRGACGRDSGGPLVCRVGNKYELVGAGSFTYQCATNSPSVYSRITHFRSWIKANTGV